MLRAGVGYSLSPDTREAAAQSAAVALDRAGLSKAEAALCFATSAHGARYPLMLRMVREKLNTQNVVGCSARGVISTGREMENGAAVVTMVIGGDAVRAKRIFVPGLREHTHEAALKLAQAAKPLPAKTNLLMLFPDSYNVNPTPFLATICAELPDVHIVGGGATEDGSTGQTFQFCGDAVSSDSVAALLLSGDFEVDTAVSVAAQMLGNSHRVTAAQGNFLLELDGQPALEVFKQTIGLMAEDLRRAATLVNICIGADPRAKRLERGRFFLRNIVGLSTQHKFLAVAHPLTVGDIVGFALREPGYAREDLNAVLEEANRRSHGRQPVFGLYFDCVARGINLYRVSDHDVSYIHQALGTFALAGFFTGFEIGPLAAAPCALQYSGVLTLVFEGAG
jgi:small ligand-binding sensory domain FIST